MSCLLKLCLGVVIGGAVGYGLRSLLCAGGGCPITSNRFLMVLVGAVIGGYFGLTGCARATATATPAKQAASPAAAKAELETPDEFQARVIQSQTPVVVDFFATWCGPCRALAPILEKLEQDYAGRIKFVTIDVDQARELARRHNIEGIPTLELYRGGRQVDRIEGQAPETILRQHLDKLLSGS